ncbi:hypothetical protein JVU11DRAFT_8308 [Chiua virens]|nr:hypothetical protein JVU11DRAFT_8308 [Chiua virens]
MGGVSCARLDEAARGYDVQDDEITVLMQLPEPGIFLGHCEGVVGRFSGKDVRFHGKLKKPVKAKRGSVTVGASGVEGRMSISLIDGSSSKAELAEERSWRTESPSDSRPASRSKRTPSPSYTKSHAPMQSYSTSYSRFSEDQSAINSRDTTVVGTSHTPSIRDACASSVKAGHAKTPQMATSISGASVFSVGSIYSEASTATSVYESAADAASERTRSRNGSIYSIKSGETEKNDPAEAQYGNADEVNGHGASNSHKSPSPNVVLPGLVSSPTSMSVSSSTSSTSLAASSTYDPDCLDGSFGSIGSISELEAKQFDLSKFGKDTETQTGFVLVPPPLGIGGNKSGPASTVVAPLRVSKSPRLTPSPGLPPSSPLPVAPTASPRSTPISPALPSPLSPGLPASRPSSRPSVSSSLGLPLSLSPGLPAGQRSPGLPALFGCSGSLSPGFRSPTFSLASNTSQYTFSSSSGSNSPNPNPSFKSPYDSIPSSTPTSPHVLVNSNPNDSVPPSQGLCLALHSPLQRLLREVPATAAASGRTSPLTTLSASSLPTSMSGTLHTDDPYGQRKADVTVNGQKDESWEDGDATRLSTLHAFRRQLDDSADEDEIGYGGHSEDEAEVVRVGDKETERGVTTNQGERKEVGEGEDVDSDGEVGIGLSLMGVFGGEDDKDEEEEDAGRARKAKGGDDGESDEDIVKVKTDGNASDAPAEKSGSIAMLWTRYSPTSPINLQSPNGHSRTEEEQGEDGGEVREEEEGEEEEDDGAYWDDIYDGYRYSRYSLASKFSGTSRRVSVTSKSSGASKSSRTRANAPPIPIPPDRPSVDTPRPSIGSDGTGGYPRPSMESRSSSLSASMPLSRPSLSRTASSESANVLPLTAQFPAVPEHLPVRTESRLRIVHDVYTQGGDAHDESEQQVEHGSTEGDMEEVGLNIEVVEATEEDRSQGQEVVVGRPFTSGNVNMSLSPLLHTTFGSPHSSRFTDGEDGSSDQDHGRRYSSKSGKSTMSSVEGPPPKSPTDGGGMTSALKVKTEVERTLPSGTVPPLAAPVSTSIVEPGPRAIVVGDEGSKAGISITINGPILATKLSPHLAIPSTQRSNIVPPTVAAETPQTNQPEDVEKSSFLRPRPQPSQSPHPFSRTSMFLPHPNAPKAVHQSPGPMYGRTVPQQHSFPDPLGLGAGTTTHQPTPPGTTFYSIHILHQLRNVSNAASQGPARRPPMTLFARCHPELNVSMGPVPILFSLDPFPPVPTLPLPKGPQVKIGGGKGTSHPGDLMPMRAATVSAPVRRGEGEGVLPSGTAMGAGDASLNMLRPPKRSATAVASASAGPSSPLLPIPREGFIPHVGAARPRSRSFSEFGAHVPGPVLQKTSREEPVMANVVAPPRNGSLPPALMPRRGPPPLVLNGSNRDQPASPVASLPMSTHVRGAPSSLIQEPVGAHSPQLVGANSIPNSPIVSSPLVNGSNREDASPSPSSTPPSITCRASVSSLDPRSAASPHSLMPRRQESLDVPRNGSVEGRPRQSSESSDSRSLVSSPPLPEGASQHARISPAAQELALRTKLSLPALRMKASVRSKLDDAVSIMSFPTSGENETVQVQDMDFELVKPTLPSVTGRASQDSTATSREVDVGKPDASPIPGDASSMHSHAPRSPLVPTTVPPTESAESIDAHRQRELKWMALFPTVPPSQARKNKKVRKLLQEGVPSSVRYLVWCHLTDSKARALPGVYAKLGKRPRVPAFGEIERDAEEGFPDQPQLHTARGPVASLLQAYLSMVPDIQYNSGLTSLAGHLLLLAPEEDAFWIYASMMDAHLRSYFSTNTTQIEIDAALFSKALEAIDPMLTKKLYVQLSIAPANITRPWFSSLFVGSLSMDHLHRVWDIFLYDGIPYLFRVGLVVINCVRHLLLQATTEEAALAHLARPPAACLPSATELLVLAANVKLKDDDLRKQRVKMEQQLKRTTQARPPNGLSSVQIAAISLPTRA